MDADTKRFWSCVQTTNDDDSCWEWQRSLSGKAGYGQFVVQGRHFPAHRWIYQQLNGDLPRELFVCHHCDNPKCVRLSHLFVGTARDNAEDMVKKGRQSVAFGRLATLPKDEARKIQVLGGYIGGRSKSAKKLEACHRNLEKIRTKRKDLSKATKPARAARAKKNGK